MMIKRLSDYLEFISKYRYKYYREAYEEETYHNILERRYFTSRSQRCITPPKCSVFDDDQVI